MSLRADPAHLCALSRLGDPELDAFLAGFTTLVRRAPQSFPIEPFPAERFEVFHDPGLIPPRFSLPCHQVRWSSEIIERVTLRELLERPCPDCLDLSLPALAASAAAFDPAGRAAAVWGQDPRALQRSLDLLMELEAARSDAAHLLEAPVEEYLAGWVPALARLQPHPRPEPPALHRAAELLRAECDETAAALEARLASPESRDHLITELRGELSAPDCVLDETPTLLGIPAEATTSSALNLVCASRLRLDSVLVCLLPRFAADEVVSLTSWDAAIGKHPRPHLQTAALARSDRTLATLAARLWEPHAPGPLATLASAVEAARDLLASPEAPCTPAAGLGSPAAAALPS